MIAPSPNKMGTNVAAVVRSPKAPVKKSWPIQVKITAVPVYDNPARSAPPGRRTPNTTATASHTSPVSGSAFVLVADALTMPSMTPPRPAMPADTAKIATLVRAGDNPEVRAATSLLRTANIVRPDADRKRQWITRVTSPKTASRSTTCSDGWEKSKCPCAPGTSCWFSQFRPGMSSDGAGMVQPKDPWLMACVPKGTSAAKNANANVANASATAPSRRTGSAMRAPRAADTRIASSAAIAKFRCPWLARNGALIPQLRSSAHPAAKPPAVTNVA